MLLNCATATSRIRTQPKLLLLLLLQSKVSLSTGVAQCAKPANLRSQAKILGKLFGDRIAGSKKRWYPTHEGNATVSQTAIYSAAKLVKSTKQQGKNTTRRITVLNKLFMKHITDLLATGEVSEKILGRGLQVSHVKVSPDFGYVNVFWAGSGDAMADMELERELQRCSGLLRHELSQLCLMGVVPRINFVRDYTYSNIAQVESLLRHMDFGDGYEASSLTDELERDFNWKRNEAPTAIEDTKIEECITARLPEMRHDVLGLDHRSILFKIHTKMRKSKQAWEQHELGLNTNGVSSTETTDSSNSAVERVNQKMADAAAAAEKFDKFLAKRRDHRNTPERKKFRSTSEQLHGDVDAVLDEELALLPKQLRNEDDFIYDDEHDKKS